MNLETDRADASGLFNFFQQLTPNWKLQQRVPQKNAKMTNHQAGNGACPPITKLHPLKHDYTTPVEMEVEMAS